MKYLLLTIKREWRRLCSRTVYLYGIILVPVLCCLFFIWLMSQGLPQRVPVAVVDMDHSQLSRQCIRGMEAQQMLSIEAAYDDYESALASVRRGETFGFIVIPQGFERNAVAGNTPTLSFYANMTYFVPGTLSYRGFKTMGVMTTAGLVQTKLVDLGATDELTGSLIQPVNFVTNSIGNPWLNYSYYLTPSFTFGILALMIALMTVFAITIEIKNYTSRQWMKTAGGSVIIAVTGKLLPQTVLFTLSGWAIEALMFGFFHFPMAGSLWVMVWTMPLFVIACQAMALFFTAIVPNPRLAFSVIALVCILTFSFAGFSFPVENMYGYIGVLSYIVPVRYYFLIYINEALWGAPLYYARWYIAALLMFPLVAALPLFNLKRALLRPVYVP